MANMENGSGNGLNIDKIVDFCKKNVKYISAGVVTVALVAFLAVTAVNNSGKQEKQDNKVAAQDENQKTDAAEDGSEAKDEPEQAEAEKDEHPEITELISTYYNSYAAGDLDKLSGIAQKLSDMEKDYIKMMNEHVESYGNVSCTVVDGAKEGAYIVCAVYDMKFAGVDETLPGMNVFYVQTDKNGQLYINNRYSSFNRELKEQKTKKKILTLMEEFEKSEAIVSLQQEVQAEYDKIVAGNEELQTKLNEMVDAIANWKESYTPPTEEEPEATDDGSTDDGSADDGNADDGNADDGNTDDGSTDDGNADDGSADDGSTDDGSADDGNTDDGSTDDGNSSGLNYVPEGTVMTANDGYNVRKSMDETSELVGTTAVGDSITIILSYAEGWTKVEWNGTTGYIRTDLLLNN